MKHYILLFALLLASCIPKSNPPTDKTKDQTEIKSIGVTLHVLGTVQDGGSPHIGCQKECCTTLFQQPDNTRKVVSLGVVDHENQKSYLFEATPDLPSQLKILKELSNKEQETPEGIFMTHAHIGHYSGLMYLGREALGAKNVAVFAMPKMQSFLQNNGPWNQLVNLNNIGILPLENEKTTVLTNHIQVTPFTVPHRDEYSETVGFTIKGPNKSILFIPDIDKWSKWEKDIIEEVKKVDLAFLDATFFDGDEINSRNIAEIPHPFVVESMALFKDLPESERAKIYFIHFNHTNGLLAPGSTQQKEVFARGFHVAEFGQTFQL